MAHFRKKPVVIEAWQWDGSKKSSMEILALDKSIYRCEGPGDLVELEIETLEGNMTAKIGATGSSRA